MYKLSLALALLSVVEAVNIQCPPHKPKPVVPEAPVVPNNGGKSSTPVKPAPIKPEPAEPVANPVPVIEGEVTWAAILAALSYEKKEAGFELGVTDIKIGAIDINGSITNTIETTGPLGNTTTVKTT